MALQDITDEAINEVESFARNNLHGILQKNSVENGPAFDEEDKVHFFGTFAADPSIFRFLIGERLTIHRLAKTLREIIQSNSLAFKMKKTHKLSYQNTIKTSFGQFFGRKKTTEYLDNSPNKLKADLFQKVKTAMESLELKPCRPISEDIVKIINMGERIRANIICVFCSGNTTDNANPKVIGVSAFTPANSTTFYWTITNLKKHLQSHTKTQNYDKTAEEVCKTISKPEQDIEMVELEYAGNEFETKNDKKNVEEFVDYQFDKESFKKGTAISTFCEKIHQQILNVLNLVKIDGQEMSDMKIKVNGEEKIIQIKTTIGDGNCLYRAAGHQLTQYGEVLSSNGAELRTKVVEHINKNIARYIHSLRGRIYDEEDESKTIIKKKKKAKQMTDAAWKRKCKYFLNHKLTKRSQWGGYESLCAISEMFSTNILIFYEKDECHFVDFNSTFKQTICLAFRLSDEFGTVHNHYDSVCDINYTDLFESVQKLNLFNEQKKVDLEDTEVVLIDD